MSRVQRCRGLDSPRAAFAVFRTWPSPQIIAGGLTAAIVVRLAVGRWSWWDLAVAIGIVFAATPFTEWMIHKHLLHAGPDTFAERRLGTGAGHREHHLDPESIAWLLLGPGDAVLYQVMIAALVVTMSVTPLWLLGAPLLAPAATAVIVGFAKLLEYEWDHFLFHCTYRPRSRWYRHLDRNHRLHHFRNEHYWLGVTHTFGDRVLRTGPKTAGDVPLSPTARNLGIDADASS